MTVDHASMRRSLRRACVGEVLQPEDVGYAGVVSGQVQSVQRRPALVLCAREESDLAAAVGIARDHRATVGVLATGHATRSSPNVDLLISTADLRLVELDEPGATVRVSAGARWGDVLAVTEPRGLVPLSGSHASVGAVGYTLGGGLGTLARSHGYASDRVRSFDVVTADGEQLVVDAEHHADLFRGLRGGGREGLALVAGMTVEVVSAAEVFGGSVVFDAGNETQTAALYERYVGWTRQLSTHLSSSLAIVRVPDVPGVPAEIRGRTVVQLGVCHTGSHEHAERECADVDSWGAVLSRDLHRRAFSELAIDEGPAPGWGGAVALRDVTDETVAAWVQAVGPEQDVPFAVAQLRHVGGAARDGGGDRGLVAGRDAEYVLFLGGVPVPELIAGPIPRAADAVFAVLEPWISPALPTNYADHLDAASRATAWPAAERAEIAALRDRWDPAGMFGGWAG